MAHRNFTINPGDRPIGYNGPLTIYLQNFTDGEFLVDEDVYITFTKSGVRPAEQADADCAAYITGKCKATDGTELTCSIDVATDTKAVGKYDIGIRAEESKVNLKEVDIFEALP